MIFGLDFDGTITARPNEFYKLANNLYHNGDKVIVSSNRTDNRMNRMFVEDFLANYDYEKVVSAVLLTGGMSKREHARKNGYEVDIWIDDNPILVDFGQQGFDELYDRDRTAIKG